MSSPSSSKISIYSLSDLKTTLDDHIPIYLSSSTTPSEAPLPRNLRFVPSESHTYIRLGLGYSAVGIALYIFYLDYIEKVEFRDIKALTTWSVVAYFVLNCALQAWIWFGERGIVFVGERQLQVVTAETAGDPDGRKKRSKTRLEIYSLAAHKKYDPNYRLSIVWYDASVSFSKSLGKDAGKGPAEAKEISLAVIKAVKEGTSNSQGQIEIDAPYTQFFTQDGHFIAAAFESWLREKVPLIDGFSSVKSTGERKSEKKNEDLISAENQFSTITTPPVTATSFSSSTSQRKTPRRRA